MPRFNITAEFDLSTEIEPEVTRWDSGSVEEFEDSSYFQSTQVESSGGSFTFVIEADDEEGAEEAVREEVIFDGQEVEDDNGFTWIVENLNVEVEAIEEPMTLERAKEIILQLTGSSSEEVREAAEFLLDTLTSMEARIAEANARIDGLVERVRVAESRENA